MNHRRGVVTNSAVVQNRRGQRPEGISHVNVSYKLSWRRCPVKAGKSEVLCPRSDYEEPYDGRLSRTVL
ncbi:MAG: hypothetical protein AAF693_18600 [Bacteroidota bacterium]